MKPGRAYLDHILRCARRIRQDSAAGKDAVLASETLQDAIIRNPQILCESTQRLSDASKRRHPQVDWRGIAGLRNVLVHSYFEIDFETVWTATEQDLPGLEEAVRELLQSVAPGD